VSYTSSFYLAKE